MAFPDDLDLGDYATILLSKFPKFVHIVLEGRNGLCDESQKKAPHCPSPKWALDLLSLLLLK